MSDQAINGERKIYIKVHARVPQGHRVLFDYLMIAFGISGHMFGLGNKVETLSHPPPYLPCFCASKLIRSTRVAMSLGYLGIRKKLDMFTHLHVMSI